MNSDEPTPIKPVDQIAARARAALVAGSIILVACLVYSAVAEASWLSWVLARGWVVALAVVMIALIAWLLFDATRAKNVAWRSLQGQFGAEFGAMLDQKNFATGQGQVGSYRYSGLRCFGSPSGLEINRIIKFVNRPLYIPWSAMSKIDTFPSLLTGRKDFETDMQAQISLSDQPDLSLEVPWLTEYRELLPKLVKYRAIKLSKK